MARPHIMDHASGTYYVHEADPVALPAGAGSVSEFSRPVSTARDCVGNVGDTTHTYDRASCSALRLATPSYAIRFFNRIRLPSEVVCDRKLSCEERSD